MGRRRTLQCMTVIFCLVRPAPGSVVVRAFQWHGSTEALSRLLLQLGSSVDIWRFMVALRTPQSGLQEKSSGCAGFRITKQTSGYEGLRVIKGKRRLPISQEAVRLPMFSDLDSDREI